MKKSTIVNLSLVLVSVFVTLILAEIALRIVLFGNSPYFEFLRNPAYYTLYPKDGNEDFYSADYWKLHYRFHPTFNLEHPHPLLGWTGYFNAENYDHWHVDKTGVKRPVLLYGDSFAMCVDSVTCFEDYLNNDTAFSAKNHLHNYGTGGYGIDQIYLLFHESVDKYQHPYVILSMLTTDLDRSLLPVRDAQKPYFDIEDNELVLKNTPITLSSKEYFAQNPPEINSYLFNWLVNSFRHLFGQDQKERNEYIDRIKVVNEKILKKAFDELKALNTDFVVLIFQPAWQLPDWRLDFLLETCKKNNVPYINEVSLREKAISDKKINPAALYIEGDGHPTSLANKIVAEELKKQVLSSNDGGE